MKIAIIADTHCGARNDTEVFNAHFLKFFTEQFIPYLDEHNIKHIIHLGDVFDRRKYVNLKTLNSWKRNIFNPLEEREIKMHIIIGNHDTYFKSTNDVNSPTELLRDYSNIKVYSKPSTIKLGGLDICFIPWVNDENLQDTLDEIEKTKAEVAMGHLEIKGFEQIRGHVNTDIGFSKSQFKKFDAVFSGHYHHRSNGGNIHYLGSPYGFVWSDWNDSRGFHVFETRTRDLEFIENPNEIFHKIYYKDGAKTFESIRDTDYSYIKDCYVKVIVEEKTNPYLFEQFLEALYQENPADLNVIDGYDDLDEDDPEAIDQAKDTMTILREYINALDLQDKKELIKLMHELYSEASDIEV